MEKFNQLAKKKKKKKKTYLLKVFLSSMKTKLAVKFPKKIFIFLPKISLALKRLITMERPFFQMRNSEAFLLKREATHMLTHKSKH